MSSSSQIFQVTVIAAAIGAALMAPSLVQAQDPGKALPAASKLRQEASKLQPVAGVQPDKAGPALTVTTTEEQRLWFVELRGAPVADGARMDVVRAEQDRFRAAARAAGVNFTERLSYATLFNGFSVSISPVDRLRLSRLPEVKAMYPVDIIPAPSQPVSGDSAPDMAAALDLTGASIAQNQLGLSGQGVKVAIIDSGVDIDHPAFGGAGTNGATPFPTARVIAGFDFVGDNYNSIGTPAQQIPVPDQNPDDCGGHGTHVAGIVGANGGGVRGVAPSVSLGAYRVFGCGGSSSSDIILAAYERALADGMQVINQSLGAARQWPDFPTAQASSRLARKGIVVVASIGNNGPGGSQPDALFAAGAPGTGRDVIGVASFDNGQRSFQALDTSFGYNAASGSPLPPTTGTFPMSRTGLPTATNDACDPLPAGSLTGTVALIQRGTCGFVVKAGNAQAAGAAAVVLFNNAPGALNPSVTGTPTITIPVVAITQAQGQQLSAAIGSTGATLTWTPNFVGAPFGTGGLLSGFSSFGVAADLSMKPQLGAPGGGILSTYPLELGTGGVATLSGTSMSAPHVAGATALILQALPNAALGAAGPLTGRNPPPRINMMTRIMNTAQPKALAANPTGDLLDHSFRQGAGMLNVPAAVLSQQFVVPAQIATGESQAGPSTTRLILRNDSGSPVTYTLGHRPSAAATPNVPNAAGSVWVSSTVQAPATVSFSSNTVTVPGNGTAQVMVTIDANATQVDRGLYGGYITFTSANGGAPLVVPFGGMKGDYQTTELLRATTAGYPWLSSRVSTPDGFSYTNCPTGCSFTLANDASTPYIAFQLAHHARKVQLDALDATSGAELGRISLNEFVGRNAGPGTGSFFGFPWDGVTSQGTQPNGTYRIRLSVLKPLGNEANPAHWETWTSPVVTIARP